MAWTKEDITTDSWEESNIETSSWGEETIAGTSFSPEGVLIYLATEGSRERLMSEGELEYLMYSKRNSWGEISISDDTWSKVNIEVT